MLLQEDTQTEGELKPANQVKSTRLIIHHNTTYTVFRGPIEETEDFCYSSISSKLTQEKRLHFWNIYFKCAGDQLRAAQASYMSKMYLKLKNKYCTLKKHLIQCVH